MVGLTHVSFVLYCITFVLAVNPNLSLSCNESKPANLSFVQKCIMMVLQEYINKLSTFWQPHNNHNGLDWLQRHAVIAQQRLLIFFFFFIGKFPSKKRFRNNWNLRYRVKLGYNELGYKEHSAITNKMGSLGWFQSFYWCIYPVITNRIRL